MAGWPTMTAGVLLVARRHVDFGRVYSCTCLFS